MATSVDFEEDLDGHSSITGSTLRKAVAELNEDPETRGSQVKELRTRIIQREAELQVVNYVAT